MYHHHHHHHHHQFNFRHLDLYRNIYFKKTQKLLSKYKNLKSRNTETQTSTILPFWNITLVHCIQTSEDIIAGSPIILVLWPISADTQFEEERLQRGHNIQGGGWENLTIFDWNRRLSRKRYEICPWLLWNVNRKSYAFYRTVTFSMPWRTPNPVFKITALLKSNISIHLKDKVTIEH